MPSPSAQASLWGRVLCSALLPLGAELHGPSDPPRTNLPSWAGGCLSQGGAGVGVSLHVPRHTDSKEGSASVLLLGKEPLAGRQSHM